MELERIERRLALIERFENVASVACGALLAVPWVLWWWKFGRIAIYSWVFPFAVGVVIPRIFFAFWGARLDEQRRAITHPEELRMLPAARLISEADRRAPEPEQLRRIATQAPDPSEPAGEKPRFLG